MTTEAAVNETLRKLAIDREPYATLNAQMEQTSRVTLDMICQAFGVSGKVAGERESADELANRILP